MITNNEDLNIGQVIDNDGNVFSLIQRNIVSWQETHGGNAHKSHISTHYLLDGEINVVKVGDKFIKDDKTTYTMLY